MIRVGFLVAGLKGLGFFSALRKYCTPTFVCSYQVKGTQDHSLQQLQDLCREERTPFSDRKNLPPAWLHGADLVFVVGWQFLLPEIDRRYVIFHDSLLPRYRGFSPTVNALINGESEIGVTALQPTATADNGPIYAQASVKVRYPIKLAEALKLVDVCYEQVAREVLERSAEGILFPEPQDESKATYSLWRDEQDYRIDWSWPAENIARFVDAVGWPFAGALTSYRGENIRIDVVEVLPDLTFEQRMTGKLWQLENGKPVVVCGQGLLRIIAARQEDGSPVTFDRLRERLGSTS